MRLYCIEHGEMFEVVETEFCPMAHDLGPVTFIQDGVVVIEPNYCCFDMGYAFSAPEHLGTARLAEIPDEETEHLNQLAQESLTDFS